MSHSLTALINTHGPPYDRYVMGEEHCKLQASYEINHVWCEFFGSIPDDRNKELLLVKLETGSTLSEPLLRVILKLSETAHDTNITNTIRKALLSEDGRVLTEFIKLNTSSRKLLKQLMTKD